MGKKDIPLELKEKQELKRQETMQRVEEAILDLNSEGHKITIQLLMDRTGLSRSTFSKEHVQSVLKQHYIGRYSNERKFAPEESLRDIVAYLQTELKTAERNTTRLNKAVKKLANHKQKLQDNLKIKAQECELLRGRMLLLFQKATNRGIDLGEFE